MTSREDRARSRGNLRWIFFVIALATVFFIYSFLRVMEPASGLQPYGFSIPRPIFQAPRPQNTTEKSEVSARSRFVERRGLVREACAGREELFVSANVRRSLQGRFLVDHRHRFAFCFIPKVGCSFWKRVFQVLQGLSESRLVYNSSGIKVHGLNRHITLEKASPQQFDHVLHNYTLMTISRDPFERLFSGYVDKIFALPNQNFRSTVLRVAKNLTRSMQTCEDEISFGDFVHYFLRSEQTLQYRNEHYLPQWELCDICRVPYHYISKMETFTEDAFDVLQDLNLTSEVDLKKDDPSVNDLSIIRDLVTRSCSDRRVTCPDRNSILRRLWRVFQIRGFIHIHEPFPMSSQDAYWMPCPSVYEVFDKAYRSQNGTRTERMRQRKESFLEAYHSLSRGDLDKLRAVFRKDCDVYDYDCDRQELASPDSQNRTRKYFTDF